MYCHTCYIFLDTNSRKREPASPQHSHSRARLHHTHGHEKGRPVDISSFIVDRWWETRGPAAPADDREEATHRRLVKEALVSTPGMDHGPQRVGHHYRYHHWRHSATAPAAVNGVARSLRCPRHYLPAGSRLTMELTGTVWMLRQQGWLSSAAAEPRSTRPESTAELYEAATLATASIACLSQWNTCVLPARHLRSHLWRGRQTEMARSELPAAAFAAAAADRQPRPGPRPRNGGDAELWVDQEGCDAELAGWCTCPGTQYKVLAGPG